MWGAKDLCQCGHTRDSHGEDGRLSCWFAEGIADDCAGFQYPYPVTETVTETKTVEPLEKPILFNYTPEFEQHLRETLPTLRVPLAHVDEEDNLHYGGQVFPPPAKAVIPTDSAERKRLPVFSGVMKYFFLALLEVAKVSRVGNDKHNPGQPLHWSRGKSDDHLDAAGRHMLDYASGSKKDVIGVYHLAEAAWRILAQLQLDLEAELGYKQESK